MSVLVKGNLIIIEKTGNIIPVQHIRGIELYGGNVIVKLAGSGTSMIEMDGDKDSTEIIQEITDAYLLAQQNFERKNYPIMESKPIGNKLSKSEAA